MRLQLTFVFATSHIKLYTRSVFKGRRANTYSHFSPVRGIPMENFNKDWSGKTHITLLQMLRSVFKEYTTADAQRNSEFLLVFASFEVPVNVFVPFDFL